MSVNLKGLETKRAELYRELSEVGDLRRGSIAENYRRCGKSGCACNRSDHPGHGPQYLLMRKEEGRSVSRNLHAGKELEIVGQQVANHARFRQLMQEIVQVNEQICEARLAQSEEGGEAKKNSSRFSKRNSRRK